MPPESTELELVVAFAYEMIVTEKPVDPPPKDPKAGQVRLQVGDRCVLWRWENEEWGGYSLRPIFGYGSPDGDVVADCDNQEYVDLNETSSYFSPGSGSGRWISAYGAGSTSWKQFGYYEGS